MRWRHAAGAEVLNLSRVLSFEVLVLTLPTLKLGHLSWKASFKTIPGEVNPDKRRLPLTRTPRLAGTFQLRNTRTSSSRCQPQLASR
jgi:hypothetical protein